MPFFSIIIPVYNRESLITRTLQSVFQQTCEDYEIIAIDDGSTDDSLEMLQQYSDRITVLHQANAGPGVARNLGAQHATGEYLAFLDSDDLWFPWTLQTYRQVVLGNDFPSFVTGKQFIFRDPAELESVKAGALSTESFVDYLSSGDEWRWFGVSSFVIRRDVFSSVGGFIPGHVNGEDADLALRLGCAEGFVHICSPVMFAYHEHEDNLTWDEGKNLAAGKRMVEQEKAGGFPGGKKRARERQRIICRHIRPCILSSPARAQRKATLKLYASTFGWHVQQRRFRFLLGVVWIMLRKGKS